MKKLLFLLLLILSYPSNPLLAQKDELKLNFYDGEFFLSDESYEDALLSYQKVYNAGFQDNANLNYRMGVCYLNLEGEKNKAIPYLEKAIKNISENYSEGSFKELAAAPDALLFLANAYRIDNQLDKAIETYTTFIDRFQKGYEKEQIFASQQIEACKRAKEAIKTPVTLVSVNLGNIINSNTNNFNAVLSGNDSAMAYMSARKFYDAVYYRTFQNGRWTNPVNITPQIQSDGDQYVSSLSKDGKEMFLVKISNFDSDILVSFYDNLTWSPSKNLGKPINTKFFESNASLSPDGQKLYFTSNRSGGIGEMDIYVSEKTARGEWGEPVNLGKNINTPMNEDSPFVTADGKKLFFSSQGHATIGGYDIFYCTLNDDGTWSEPIPEPYPLNTTDDDIFFYPIDEGNEGYLTRYEPDGFGSGDIYNVKLRPAAETASTFPAEQEMVIDTSSKKVAENIQTVENPLPETITTEPAKEIKTPEIRIKEPSPTYFIKPVFFDFDSYTITENAKQKLSDVRDVMNEYSALKLEVRGHTDAIGSESYNQALSEKRAQAVIKYLTGLGISAERMQFKGFSKDKPVAMNRLPDGRDSKQGRQLNRRVEFRILGVEQDNVILEPVPVPDNLKIK